MGFEKKASPVFRIIKRFLQRVYPTTTFVGELPDEACVIVGNHSQIHGPLICELFFPGRYEIWCAGAMLHLKQVPAYAFADFWSQKPKRSHPYYKLCSYMIAPLSVFLFGNAHTIGVYRSSKLLTTFRNTVGALSEGENVIIFPEHDVKRNHIVYEFEDKFIDVAKLHYKRTGKELCFVPMYIAPRLKQAHFGRPVRFSAEAPIDRERERICTVLMDEITRMAEALPEHTVVPYRNIPKKYYPTNKGEQA